MELGTAHSFREAWNISPAVKNTQLCFDETQKKIQPEHLSTVLLGMNVSVLSITL